MCVCVCVCVCACVCVHKNTGKTADRNNGGETVTFPGNPVIEFHAQLSMSQPAVYNLYVGPDDDNKKKQ